MPASVIRSFPPTLRQAQRLFEATGGLHAAGLFDLDGNLLWMAEDVGRHNAVDKITGRMLLEGKLPLSRTLLQVTMLPARVPFTQTGRPITALSKNAVRPIVP